MNRNRKNILIKVVFTAIFLVIVVNKIDYKVLMTNIAYFPLLTLVIAFVISLFQTLIGAFSLYAIYKKENILKIFFVTLKSNFYAMFLPGQILGESTKILMLSSTAASVSERFSAVAIDKGLNIVSMAVVGCVGGIFSSHSDMKLRQYLFMGMILSVLAIILARNAKVLNFVWNQVKKIIRREVWVQKGQNFLEIWLEYTRRDKEILISTIWGIVYQLSIVLVYYVLSLGLGMLVSFWDYCWINAVLTIILFLPISISGVGVRETTLIGLLGLLHIPSEQAVALSILILFIQISRATLGGIVLLVDRENGEKRKNYEKDTSH